jgi:hypothetical protein
MSNWALVEDQVVKEEVSEFPKNWKNISNFFALESDTEKLKQLGWYQLVDVTQPITDDFLQYHGSPDYSIDHEQGVVTKNRPILVHANPMSQEERHAQARESFLMSLREERKVRLLESDWTQSADLQMIKSDEWKVAWAGYRQTLRDLPQVYSKEELLSVIDINQVDWPVMPEID